MRFKRTLNTKLLLGLVAGAAAAGVGVHVLHGAQVRRGARALLVQADRAKDRGETDKERDYLGRYLAYEPGDAAALARLGRLREAEAKAPADLLSAVRVYEKALLRDPDDQETRRRLVRLAVPLELFSEAKGHLEFWPPDQLDGELAALYGRCEEGVGRFAEAAERYRQALGLEPTRIETYTRLADLLRAQLHDPDQADLLMNARQVDKKGLIAANPNSALALLARARYRQRYKIEVEGVAADVDRALKLAPDGPDELLAAAEQAGARALEARSKGNRARAGAELDRGVELLEHGVKRLVSELDAPVGGRDEVRPKLARMYLILSGFHRQAERPEDAVATLRQGAKLLPDDAPALEWALADLLIQLGRIDEAAALIDGGQPAGVKPARAAREAGGLRATVRPELIGYLEAQIAVRNGQWAEAAEMLKTTVIPATAARPEALEQTKRARLLLAGCYERLGDAGGRHESARLAAAINLPEPDPLRVPAHLELAASLVDLGRFDDALEQYRRVLPREPKAGFAVARLQMAKALRLPEAERDWKPVDQTLEQLGRTVPESTELTILRAEALTARGKRDAALEVIDKALVEHHDQAVLWVAKAGLAGQGGTAKEALAVLDEGRRRLGPRIEFAIARIAQLAKGGGDDAASALAEVERQAEEFKFSDSDRDRLERELGAAYARIGRDRDARKVWTRLAERRKDDLTVRLFLFDLAMLRKDYVDAERAIEEVRRVEARGGPLHDYGKARLLMARAEQSPEAGKLLTEAGGLLAMAGARRPDWAQVPLAEAEIAMRDHQPDLAIAKYARAVVELRDRTPAAVLGLLQLLGERGRSGEALTLIQELRKEGPLSIALRRLGAELAYRDRNCELGLSLLTEADAARSNDYRDPLLAGLLCSDAGRPAEPLLRRAVALAPLEPKVHEALILYLAARGRKDQATRAILEAKQALPADLAATALVLAKGYLTIDNRDEAGRIYEAALAARRDDAATLRDVALYRLAQGDQDAAEGLLREVVDLKGADPAIASTARRTLAELAARGGRPADAGRALRVLGLDGATATGVDSSPEDLRAKARILAGQPGRARRREAIALLEGLRKRRAETADDLFLLAQLHELDGDWPGARDLMLKLLNDHPGDPVYRTRYIEGLLRNDRADEARFQFERLRPLVSDPSVLVPLEASVLKAGGRNEQAVARLREFARGGDGRLEFVARRLEAIGEPDAAESMYREAAKVRPEAVLALAGHLGRRDKVKEAVDLIDDDRIWRTLPPEDVARTSVAIFQGAGSGDEQQRRRLSRRLEAAVRRHPEKDALQFDLANLRMLQGRYADAEAVFRAVHERDRTKSAPLNNLAWLLAVRGDGRGPEALSLVQKAIELDGERPELLDTRGVVHLANGQAALAVQDLEDAVVAAPSSAEMRYHLARAYLTAGKRVEAVRTLRDAESLGLTAETLHPLERKTFDQLRGDLARR